MTTMTAPDPQALAEGRADERPRRSMSPGRVGCRR